MRHTSATAKCPARFGHGDGRGTPKLRDTHPATSRANPYIGFPFRCSPDPKTERIRGRIYRSLDQARAYVFDCIECFFNPRRRHSIIGYLSFMDFETLAEARYARCSLNRQQAVRIALGTDAPLALASSL